MLFVPAPPLSQQKLMSDNIDPCFSPLYQSQISSAAFVAPIGEASVSICIKRMHERIGLAGAGAGFLHAS